MLRVGIFTSNLSSHYPRGVARVARAVTEQLAPTEDFELHAILDPYYYDGQILVESMPLSTFLRQVPLSRHVLVSTQRETAQSEEKGPGAFSRILARMLGWTTKHPWPSIAYSASRKLRVVSLTRPIYHFVRRHTARVQSPDAAPDHVDMYDSVLSDIGSEPESLNSFDAIVSFEAFEDVWDWPVEALRCATVGYMHDAIPLRLDEGPGGSPDHFLRAVGKMAVRADRIVCVSEATRNDLEAFFPQAHEKDAVVFNGHDMDRFRRTGKARKTSDPKRFHILMVGDIDRRKNVQNVLRAMPMLARQVPDRKLHLTIVGKQEHRRHFEHLEAQAAKYARIEWTGYLSDNKVVSTYHNADVFLFPSLWEGFGIPILEAMTAEVAVVTSDVSSMPEVGSEFAFYCDPYDPASIAEALAQTQKLDGDERAARSRRAREWASAFTWGRSAHELADVIRDAVTAKRTRIAERYPECELNVEQDDETGQTGISTVRVIK